MGSHNASSVAKSQQWRNELQMKPYEPAPLPPREILKEPKYLTPVMASTTECCEQPYCDRAKIEHLPERMFREPVAPFMMNPDRYDPQLGKKKLSAPPVDQYMDSICSCCGMNRGQLVTICCIGRDCDNATKIDEVHMGPPEEKRAKTSYNHYKF